MLGRVINVQWSGYDHALGVLARLNADIALKQPIMGTLRGDSHAERKSVWRDYLGRDSSHRPGLRGDRYIVHIPVACRDSD